MTELPQETDELPPLSVAVDILEEVIKLLDMCDDLLGAHRRAVGDDHHELERLQRVSARLGQAWSATMLARKDLRHP